jgi:preprotein translocase subunit SecG
MHVLVSLMLIFIVLIQGGKGAELGAAFGGGSSQTLFGSRGATTFLGKMTTAVAVVFMLTSLLLAITSVRSKSIVPQTVPAAERTVDPSAGKIPPADAPAEPQQPTN